MDRASIKRLSKSYFHAVTVARKTVKEFHITLHQKGRENAAATVKRLAKFLKKNKAVIVKCDVFGSLKACKTITGLFKETFKEVKWPVTAVEGTRCGGKGIAGITVQAVAGVPVKTIYLDAAPLARAYGNEYATWCCIGNVLPAHPAAPPEQQAQEVFENIEKILRLAGMDLTAVLRTWFYNDTILQWYSKFNFIRNGFYRGKHVFKGLLPASTGVGGKNPAGSALVAGALALQKINPDIVIREVTSPKQCPAPQYGSSFSRAVEVQYAGVRHLFISGTASIETGGKTVHAADASAQVAFTMGVIDAILKSRNMGFAHISRSIAYFKNIQDAPLLEDFFARARIPAFPCVMAGNTVCRDDLLFEIEVDAISEL